MSPCCCRTGRAVIGPPCPVDGHRLAGLEPVLGHDRRIFAAGRRLEAIAEARAQQSARSARRGRRRRRRALADESARRSSMPWVWSACAWVIEHAVEPVDIGVEKLLAQVRRGIDQDPGAPFGPRRSTSSELRRRRFFGIVRVAGAPAERRPRHAPGGAAAEDGERSASCAAHRSRPRHLAEQPEEVLGGLARDLVAARRRASRPAPWRSRPHRPARCACRGICRARDRARRSRPGCGRPAGPRRSRAGRRIS